MEDEALIFRMLDTDALDKLLEHIDDGAYLPVWLTCKAFNARRPASTFTTSVRAMLATQSTLDWAIGIGLQSHMVLKALRDFGTAKLALASVTIPCIFTHRDEDVRVDAMETAHGLLMKLANLDPAELIDPQALATYIGFITEMLLHGRRHSSTNWGVLDAAEWAIETIVCKLGKLEAYAAMISILAEMTGYTEQDVRYGAFNALAALDTKSIAHHSDRIARFALNAAPPGGHARDCARALDALNKLDAGTLSTKLDAGTLSAFVTMVVELMWHTDSHMHSSALQAFSKIDKTAITSHAVTIARKLNDPDEYVVQRSLQALGMLNQADLAQHADAIVDKLNSQRIVCYHWTCTAFSTLRNMAEADISHHSADIAKMLDHPFLHDLAEETLDLLKPVDLVYHDPHAVAKMLSYDHNVRDRTLRTLARMDVADLRKHKYVIEHTIRQRYGLSTAEALLKRIDAESSVQLI
jgi:hypothetical protein